MKFEGKNYYEILRISYDATTEQIKEAYREVARVYHPDSNFFGEITGDKLNPEQVEAFKVITNAYHTLSHPEKRREYDRTLMLTLQGWEDHKDPTGFSNEKVGHSKVSKAWGVFGKVEPEPEGERQAVPESPVAPKSGILDKLRAKFGR